MYSAKRKQKDDRATCLGADRKSGVEQRYRHEYNCTSKPIVSLCLFQRLTGDKINNPFKRYSHSRIGNKLYTHVAGYSGMKSKIHTKMGLWIKNQNIHIEHSVFISTTTWVSRQRQSGDVCGITRSTQVRFVVKTQTMTKPSNLICEFISKRRKETSPCRLNYEYVFLVAMRWQATAY